MSTSSKELAQKLGNLAGTQGGYFTAKQAVGIGYADSVHGYHVRNGDWEKVQRGIYRLTAQKPAEWPELHIWSLWSCGRDDKPDGVYSRETALAIHGLLERNGGRIQMSVPAKFRRNSAIPQQLQLHKEDLPPSDVEIHEGVRVTTLTRTLKDIEASCTNPKILGVVQKLAAEPSAPGAPAASTAEEGARQSPLRRTEWEGWDSDAWGEPAKPMWSRGMTFDEAIEAGED